LWSFHRCEHRILGRVPSKPFQRLRNGPVKAGSPIVRFSFLSQICWLLMLQSQPYNIGHELRELTRAELTNRSSQLLCARLITANWYKLWSNNCPSLLELAPDLSLPFLPQCLCQYHHLKAHIMQIHIKV
jgi:hypothetical protein